MAAAAAERLDFRSMTKAQLRQWVEANPGRVNDRDKRGSTPLFFPDESADALGPSRVLPLVVWLLDKKGADMNGRNEYGCTPLHYAKSLDILFALLNRRADPALVTVDGVSPLMYCAIRGEVDNVARLLQDPRIQATVDMSTTEGHTALHCACAHGNNEDETFAIIYLLLQAGANPTLSNHNGLTPLAYIKQRYSSYRTMIAFLEQTLTDAEKTSLLVKARRLVVAAINTARTPSYLQARMLRGEPLPRLALAPLTSGQDEAEDRNFHTTQTFLLGMDGGSEGEGMPRDVFWVVLDMLMPRWDLLRRGIDALQG